MKNLGLSEWPGDLKLNFHLTTEDREIIFMLTFKDGLSIEQISERLGMKSEIVQSSVSKLVESGIVVTDDIYYYLKGGMT